MGIAHGLWGIDGELKEEHPRKCRAKAGVEGVVAKESKQASSFSGQNHGEEYTRSSGSALSHPFSGGGFAY